MNISKLELILVILAFLGVGIFLATFAGGPIYSDELSLMNTALNNFTDPFHLNRYTHIYLQKPFLELAHSPLAGAKIYWAFTLALTGFLTYWCARLLNRKNHPLHALIAVILYFSFHFFIDYSGVTIIDFTAMLMVMVFMSTYILASRVGFTPPWLVALGFIFFLAFKAKETTLVVSVLLLGFGFQDENDFKVKVFGKKLLIFCLGLLAGIVFFVVLNTILLHDPLFGLSPTSIRAFLDTYATLPRASIPPNSPGWISGVLAVIWILPFTLYLVSGLKQNAEFPLSIRLIWVVPLALVVFLTLMTLWRSYKIDPRFFFPVLPVLCFLGSQLLPFEAPQTPDEKLRFWLLVLVTLLTCVGVNYLIRPLAGYMDQTFEDFLNLIFYPLLLSIMIISLFFIRKFTSRTILIPLACILSMAITPIRTNIKYLAVLHQNSDRVEYRFFPLSNFANQLYPGLDQKIYVSSNLHDELDMLSSDPNEVNAMYNVYFDRSLTRQNFTVSSSPGLITQEIQQGDYDYALLTYQDWLNISADPSDLAWYGTLYDYYEDPGMSLVLLVQK